MPMKSPTIHILMSPLLQSLVSLENTLSQEKKKTFIKISSDLEQIEWG